MSERNANTLPRFSAAQIQLLREAETHSEGMLITPVGDNGPATGPASKPNGSAVSSLIRRGFLEQCGTDIRITSLGRQVVDSRPVRKAAANLSMDADCSERPALPEHAPQISEEPQDSEQGSDMIACVTGSDDEAGGPDAVPPGGKVGMIHHLLAKAGGASMAELTDATGWQPHSIRAGLTALRKKGQQIARTRDDRGTCYQLVSAI